ncbi:hypothetical protein Bpla01_53490 [Burkholderia plantarii]|nr:hypothetical protein Bpla01_53490 [Burkholderia plantarii]
MSFVVPAAVAAIQREAPSLRPRARRARAPAGIAPAPRAGPAARDPRGGAAGAAAGRWAGDENGDDSDTMLYLERSTRGIRPGVRLRVKSHFTDLLAFPHDFSEIRSRRPRSFLP